MKVLVVGGAGFIGSNLVKALVGGNEVVVLDSLHTGRAENVVAGARLIIAGASYVDALGFVPDAIYHLGMASSTPMYRKDRSLVGKVVSEAVSVLEWAKKHDSQVVVASSSSIYNGLPPPHREDMVPRVTDFYTEARLAVERLGTLYHDMSGLSVASLRFFSVYGPGEEHKGEYANLVSQFLWAKQEGKRPVVYGDGTQTRDFTHVDDVVKACQLAMGHSGVFNVGTGVSTSINQLLEILGVEADHIPVPFRGYVQHVQADTTKSERELGFKAKITLEEGIHMLSPQGISPTKDQP